MSNYIIFNINTGSNERAEQFIEPFDRDSVLVGDITRLKEYKEADTTKKKEMIDTKVNQQAAIYYSDCKKDFALNGITGKVLMIHYYNSKFNEFNQDWLSDTRSEEDMIKNFWELASLCESEGYELVSYNGEGFDIPFLLQRSAILNIPIYPLYEGKWLKNWCRDMYKEWIIGRSYRKDSNVKISNGLNEVAYALGYPKKLDKGISRNFEKYFIQDIDMCLQYGKDEIEQTKLVYDRLNNIIDNKTTKEDFLGKDFKGE